MRGHDMRRGEFFAYSAWWKSDRELAGSLPPHPQRCKAHDALVEVVRRLLGFGFFSICEVLWAPSDKVVEDIQPRVRSGEDVRNRVPSARGA